MGTVPGASGAVCTNPAGTVSDIVYVPGGRPRKEKLPDESDVAFTTVPPEFRSWITTPERPGSPGSRAPLPFRSLNFVPAIDPIAPVDWLPKRKPVAF